MLEAIIRAVSPRLAYQRQAWRQGLEALGDGERSYAAAERGRKTADWRASYASGDAELFADLSLLVARHRQMCRDNPYMASALRNLTAALSGVTGRATHPDPQVASLAQGLWDEAANTANDVEERNDFYGNQKIAIRSMIEGGETLINWRALGNTPNARVLLMEGDQLDRSMSTLLATGNRVIMGVEYDQDGRRVAYHLFDHHPGDQLAWLGVKTNRVPAQDIDHLFERTRISGAARGVPWFHAGLRLARDIGELEESTRIKKRIEACLAIFRKAGETGAGSPLGANGGQTGSTPWETLRPGMIVQGQPGEDISVVNPSTSQDEGFHKSQLMAAAAAAGVPYYLLSGDVSQANFSSQRADMVGYWLRQDDWTYHTIEPYFCRPWSRRIMQVAALQRRDPRLLQVRFDWTPQPRAWVNPLQDVTAQLIEIRAGLTSYAKALAERGLDYRRVLAEIAEVNKLNDELGLALDSDPRRLTDQGILQDVVGYLAKSGKSAE